MIRFWSMLPVVLLLAVPLAADENPREKMAMLIGDWTIAGRESSYRENCEWFEGRSHVVCNSESQGKKGLRRGVSVFSYSEELGRYLYYHYGSSGVAVAQDVWFSDGVLRATSERESDRRLVRSQVRMSRRADGSLDFYEEESTDGGSWVKSAEVHYVPRAPKAGEAP